MPTAYADNGDTVGDVCVAPMVLVFGKGVSHMQRIAAISEGSSKGSRVAVVGGGGWRRERHGRGDDELGSCLFSLFCCGKKIK